MEEMKVSLRLLETLFVRNAERGNKSFNADVITSL